jgi:cobalt-precorrin-5B (C1)-methyltransferase
MTGSASEAAIQGLYGLSDTAPIEMADFVCGMLKYMRRHPVPRVTVAGGFAKTTKFGQDLLDLHSRSGSVNRSWLAALLQAAGAPADLIMVAAQANTAQEIVQAAEACGIPLADRVVQAAWQTASRIVAGKGVTCDVVIFNRGGLVAGRFGL